MIEWRLSLGWLVLASLGSVSAAGLSGAQAPAVARAPALVPVNAALPAILTRRPTVTARRDANGLFYATLSINGHPVRFLIDTGATHMVLRTRDAQGIAGANGDLLPAALTTVGGVHAARWARLDDVAIDRMRIGAVDTIITDSDLPASLLGQDVLSRLGSLRIEGDELTVGGQGSRS